MIKKDIKQITDIKELQRLYIELNNETEKQEKEIERLKNRLEESQLAYLSVNEKNNKAIKYIEQQYKYEETAKEDYDILLDILKGIDKND